MVKTGKTLRSGKSNEETNLKIKPRAKVATNNEQDRAPFSQKWINECFEKLIFPNENCVKIMSKVNGALPRHVLKSQSSEQKQQALFMLLGEAFTEQHFPKHKIKREVLEPPKIDAAQKEKYLKEMRQFLKGAVKKAMEDCGIPSDVSVHKEESDDLGRYIQEIKNQFKDGFSTHVALEAFNQESNEEVKKDAKIVVKKKALKDDDDDDQSDDDDDQSDDDSDDKVGITFTEEGDSAGKTFLSFLNYDDRKKNIYKTLFCERHLCLPSSLRKYFWWEYFKEKEAKKLNLKSGEDVKDIVRKNYEVKLKESLKKQGSNNTTKSKNAKNIDSHLVEIIDGSQPLKNINNDEFFMFLTNAVNMADIHSGQYSPLFSLFLIPLQIAFANTRKYDNKDYILYLATRLTLFHKHCQLTSQEIFGMADIVIARVKDEDPEYLKHITNCLTTQTNRSQPLDFLPEAFLGDSKEATKNFNSMIKKGKKEEESVRERHADALSDPAIFIRKWLSQAFVGVLSINGMMWAWDQLFLREWSREAMLQISLCILALIKPWMLRANMYSGARKVLIEEPSKLYTSDLRSALQCLESGCLFTQIPMTKNFIDGSTIKENNKMDSSSKFPLRPPKPVKPPVPVLPFLRGTNFELQFDLRDPDPPVDNDDDVVPVQERRPDSDSEDDEVPNRVRDPDEPPTPPDSPPPSPTDVTWIPRDLNHTVPIKPCGKSDPFDIYVDYVRFLPDPIIVCKVIGRIINSGLPKESVGDILAYPLQESYQRSPTFKFKLPVNSSGQKMDSRALIIFKVYGYQGHSKTTVALGGCLFGLFATLKSKTSLKTGGHQIRLRSGGPNPSVALTDLEETDMNNNSIIPGSSLCIRILAASKIYDPIPRYEEGFYESLSAKPNTTEKRLFQHYTFLEDYKTLTVGDSIREHQKDKKEKILENGPLLQKYMEKMLDHKTFQKKNKSVVPDLDFSHFVYYEQDFGFNVCIQGGFGFPETVEGYYTHALGEYLPSKVTRSKLSAKELDECRVLTRRIDMTSPQRSPNWLDLKTTFKPPYDENGILLVRIFGIRPKYIPTEDDSEGGDDEDPFANIEGALEGHEDDNDDHITGGIIQPRGKNAFFIDYDEPLAWSIVELFDKEYSICGMHRVAIFEGEPSKEVLRQIEKGENVSLVLLKNVSDGILQLVEHGLLEVEVWDGHLETEDIPEPITDIQLAKLGIHEEALDARAKEFELTFADFIFETLSTEMKSKGTASNKFVKESYIFQNEANTQFINSLNKALRYAKKEEIK